MLLDVDRLSFSYRSAPVLHDVSFSVEQGALVAVLGPNGAGKTTLFRCILRFLTKYGGNVRFDGRDTATLSRRQMAAFAAYIPQAAEPIYDYTVLDTVLMGRTGALSPLRAPAAADEAAAQKALEQLGIAHLAQRGICHISGGERRLALIARALVQEARLLLMDEPTANLDYGNRQRVLSRIRRLADAGYTVLLSTHDPEYAQRYATHVLALHRGTVLTSGRTEAVLTPQLLETLYGIPVSLPTVRLGEREAAVCIPDIDTIRFSD